MNHFFAHRRQSVDLNAVESFIRRASMITNLTEPEEDPSIVFAFRAGDAFTNTSRLILLHGGQKCRLQNLDKEALKELKEKENLQMNDMSFNASTVAYLIDGDVKVTQDIAIFRYLARKYNLVAQSEEMIQQQDTFEGLIANLNLTSLSATADPQEIRHASEKVKAVLERLDQWLVGRNYLLGDQLNYTDFMLLEVLNTWFLDLLPHFLQLKSFCARMQQVTL